MIDAFSANTVAAAWQGIVNCRRWLPAVLIAALTGCASNQGLMIASFDKLTSEGERTSTALMNYRSFVSISGLTPPHAVGMLVHHPDVLTPGHAIGISPKWSYYVESDYRADAAPSAKGVRSQYLAAHAANTKAANLDYTVMLVDLMRADIPQDGDSAAGTKLARDTAKLLDVPCDPPYLDACRKAINEGYAALKEKAGLARKLATEESGKLDQLVGGKNVVITHWQGSESEAANLSVVSLGGAGASRKEALAGVAIFTGLRTRFLFAGEDILDMAREFGKDKHLLGSFFKAAMLHSAGITTYIIMAREVEYISDQDLARSVSLNLTVPLSAIETFKDYAKQMSTKTAVIGLELQKASAIGNSGRLTEPEQRSKGFSFYPPQIHQAFLRQQAEADGGYITIFAVRGELKLLETLFAPYIGGTDLDKIQDSCKVCDSCQDRQALKHRKLGWLSTFMEMHAANEATPVPGKKPPSIAPAWYLPTDAITHYEARGRAMCDKHSCAKGAPEWWPLYCKSPVDSKPVEPESCQ